MKKITFWGKILFFQSKTFPAVDDREFKSNDQTQKRLSSKICDLPLFKAQMDLVVVFEEVTI